jgi:hypothetical protein
MPVAFTDAPTVELRETAQSFELELLCGVLELREVLFDPGVRKIRQDLPAQRVDPRSELAHASNPRRRV